MKIIHTLLIIITLSVAVLAQTDQSKTAGKDADKQINRSLICQFAESALQRISFECEDCGQDARAPSSDRADFISLHASASRYKPKLKLQEALKLAENFIEKEKIDASSYYLFRVKWILMGDDKEAKEPYWFCWWVHESGALGNYIEIIVSMDGQVRRLSSM